jgi:hypothetical protein
MLCDPTHGWFESFRSIGISCLIWSSQLQQSWWIGIGRYLETQPTKLCRTFYYGGSVPSPVQQLDPLLVGEGFTLRGSLEKNLGPH